MYQIKTNNQQYDINPKTDLDWDLVEFGPGHFNIIKNNRSYRAELVEFDKEGKSFSIKIDDDIIEVTVKDQMDLLLEKMGISAVNTSRINELKAPMPGLVLDIKVEVGQTVTKGDAMLVLEAMKMENNLKSPTDAVIKSIEVKPAMAVEKGQVLIVFE